MTPCPTLPRGRRRLPAPRSLRLATVAAILLPAAFAAPPARAAEPPAFGLPVACSVGETCFVQNFADADPAPGRARDHACGALTYDGHDGTDFRPPDLTRPVAVLAAAAGTVRSTRDGVEEGQFLSGGRAAVGGRECGNGVLIDHGGGWTTQYCHMARGSVAVAPGEAVAAGATLGRIGLSGMTEFPHLHFTVRENGAAVDPFAHGAPPGACSGGRSLWRPELAAALAYRGRDVLDAGFAGGPVTSRQLDTGLPPDLKAGPQAAALVAYGRAIGLRAGDVLSVEILSPAGVSMARNRTEPLPRDQAQYLLFAGVRRAPGGFARGSYAGLFRVERDGKTVLERRFGLALSP